MLKTIKLIVTSKARLIKKYGAEGCAAIVKTLAELSKRDKERDIQTYFICLDEPAEMKQYGVKAIAGALTPHKCKKAIDDLFTRLSPDYLALLGAGDVVPYFLVPNPSFKDGGDDDAEVPTDNPYACSRAFSKAKRESYLVPDRVMGRIPDLAGSTDAARLLGYLKSAQSWKLAAAAAYADDLLICCDEWQQSGKDCVAYLSRSGNRLLISPPTGDASAVLRKRQAARLHMIKCHGAQIDATFYGQKGDSYPPVLSSTSLSKRTTKGTVVGAMCCYGAALFDPDDPAAVTPGARPIPNVYLEGGAYGFVGSTTVAWVGVDGMLCADWIVASYLRGVLRGASLGRSLLDAKQDLVTWINQQGRTPDLAEEKTLIQFCLLGDPSIHLVPGVQPIPARGAVAAKKVAVPSLLGTADERRARRAFRHETGEGLRQALPARKVVSRVKHTAEVALKQISKSMPGFSFARPIAHQVGCKMTQPELVSAGIRRAAVARTSAAVVQKKTVEYYWIGRKRKKGKKERKKGPKIIDVRMVKVETDTSGKVIRTAVLAST